MDEHLGAISGIIWMDGMDDWVSGWASRAGAPNGANISLVTSVHIPDLICALNHKARAVKLPGSFPVETLLLPQAGVVVARLNAKELPGGGGEGNEGEEAEDHHLYAC